MEDPYQTFLTDNTYTAMLVTVKIAWQVASGIVGMSEPQAAPAGL
jgi:hypothetical protein